MFRGTFTALVTPFRDDAIDVAAFENLIEGQIAAGISGVVAVGTTGESPTLSHDEREQVIRLVVTIAKKRCVVLAGTGSNATHHAVADTKMAERLGADDSLTLPFMAVGAAGVVSVASNLFPAEVCALVRAYESGDVKSAAKLHRRLFPLFKDLFIEPNPVPVKTALGWRGAISSEVRLPLCEMSEANRTRLRKTIDAFERTK